MSPVNDAYHKPGLLRAQHRIAMCQLAAAESDLAMVDTWEAAQPTAQRSLVVLDRVQQAVQSHYNHASALGLDQQQRQQQASGEAKQCSNHHVASLQTAETPASNLAALGKAQDKHQKSQVMLPPCADRKVSHRPAPQAMGRMVICSVNFAVQQHANYNAVPFAYDAELDAIRSKPCLYVEQMFWSHSASQECGLKSK